MAIVQTCLKRLSIDLFTYRGTFYLLVTAPNIGDKKENKSKDIFNL